MLLWMYICWGEEYKYKVQLVEIFEGDEVGFKFVILEIIGWYVYGYLKVEKGIYCLVRILFFNVNGK